MCWGGVWWQGEAAGDRLGWEKRGGAGCGKAKNAAFGWRGSPGHQPTSTSWASAALRTMKSSEGGSAGRPENRNTARSNVPHHALTGDDRPRYGARNAASTIAAWVAAAK